MDFVLLSHVKLVFVNVAKKGFSDVVSTAIMEIEAVKNSNGCGHIVAQVNRNYQSTNDLKLK